MFNSLKKILFSFLILTMPYMSSASQAMFNTEEANPTHHTRKMRAVEEDQKAAPSAAKQLISLTKIIVEDFQSYVSSSAKKAYDIADYSSRNPGTVLAVSLLMLVGGADAGCACFCLNGAGSPKFYGCTPDQPGCVTFCSNLGFPYNQCPAGFKGC